MGYLKGQFSSLRGLCQQINDATDHKRALAWVKTCIVILILICFVEEGDEDDEFLDELVREGTDVPGHPGDVIELLGQANGGLLMHSERDGVRRNALNSRGCYLRAYMYNELSKIGILLRPEPYGQWCDCR